jgi:hypothetical protein
MSEPISNPGRPVPLITTLFVLVLFALFFLVARYFYKPATTPAYVDAPENISKDLEWRATREARQKTLQETRLTEAQRAGSYGWADQKAGVVQLPIDRAMELTVQELAAKQPNRPIRDLPSDGGRTKF